MKAIKVVGIGKAEVQDVPLPKMREDYILVNTENPFLQEARPLSRPFRPSQRLHRRL
jgi:hypothetical protein